MTAAPVLKLMPTVYRGPEPETGSEPSYHLPFEAPAEWGIRVELRPEAPAAAARPLSRRATVYWARR